jgi:uncharacterized protein YydD (DUF2326 family)
MIHRVFSSLDKFKTLEFHPGLNLIIAERHQDSSDLQTRNRAGKSSFVQIVHFLLGGSARPGSIFRKNELEDAVFGIDVDLGPSRVIAERKGRTQGKTTIQPGMHPGWPLKPSTARGMRSNISTDDWRRVLGHIWFGLRESDEPTTYHPTFRSLFCYFARREQDDGMRRPEMQSGMQKIWDQQVALAFLLDLDWTIGAEWQRVRDREKALAELRRAARDGAFGEIISTSAQLRTQLVVAEQKARGVREALRSFEVLREYRELEREASDLTQKIAAFSNENTLDEEVIETIRRSVREEQPPEHEDIQRLYAEAGVVLPETVLRRFDDVKRFHESVISNRRSYLDSEFTAAEIRLTDRRDRTKQLDKRRGDIMRLLQSKGALDQFQRFQEEATRWDVETEALKQRFQAAQQLEGVKSELEMERGRLLQRLRRDLIEQEARVANAIATFQEISNSLYEDAGSLTLESTENGLKIEIQIQGDRSRGIQNMQVFCFDMMLMRLGAARGIGPRFLIHDSHLFDGVDERQVGRALYIGAEIARTHGWQYIVTINEDDLPRAIPEGFKIKEHILPVRLTDEREDGGLFGFRF